MKKREEMTTEELRKQLKEDCNRVLKLLEETVEKGLDVAPDVLLKTGDAFIILSGALAALEFRYIELNTQQQEENKEVPATNKKYYN